MNKETILECFFKDRDEHPVIQDYVQKYKVYLTDKVLQPANFDRTQTVTSRASDNKETSSITNTLSLCSAFSRMTIDKTVYVDITTNRNKHNIFLELETDDPTLKKWHYMDEKGNIYGPFSTIQMNDFFQFFKLNEHCKVKKNFEHDDYVPIKLIIKRYYKKILSENLNIEKGSKKSLSKKTQEFRKGDMVSVSGKKKKESFRNHGRVQRVLSHEIKPNLYFLDEIAEEQVSDDEEQQTRVRAHTTAAK